MTALCKYNVSFVSCPQLSIIQRLLNIKGRALGFDYMQGLLKLARKWNSTSLYPPVDRALPLSLPDARCTASWEAIFNSLSVFPPGRER